MKKIVLAGLVFCGLVGVQAEDLVIQSLDRNGQLIFNEVPYVVGYHVEQASSLMGSWDRIIDNIPHSGMGAITSSVPMTASTGFFRVATVPRSVPSGMVEILAGTNNVTNPDPELGSYSLTVDRFCMDAKEVSKLQWDDVYNWAGLNGYTFDNVGSGRDSYYPVERVNWYDCVKWCNARSEMEGKTPCYTVGGSIYRTGQSSPVCDFAADGYRLPTYIEWEYAARGGPSGKRFPWGDTITHDQANYYSDSQFDYDISTSREFHLAFDDGGAGPYTSPVGYFSPNGYGLYDMAGNVWEWCWEEGNTSSERIVLGGGWNFLADTARCGAIYVDDTDSATYHTGFRTVCR